MARRRTPPTRSAKRLGSTKTPGVRIIVYCEGKTEEGYINDLARQYDNPSVEVEAHGQCGVPRTVVEKARDHKKALGKRRKKSSFDQKTEVWVATDVDEHPKLDEALQMALANGIGYALSNPCFELWVSLHFEAITATIHRHDCQRRLKQHLPTYDHDKGAAVDITALPSESYHQALKRALTLHKRHESAQDDVRSNPSTTVWCLTEAIRHGSSANAHAHLQTDHPELLPFWTGTPQSSPPK